MNLETMELNLNRREPVGVVDSKTSISLATAVEFW
jgi:hypothetical protein